MPNTIALAKNYVSNLDEVYRMASVTSDLTSDPTMSRAGANANEIIYPQMSVTGLGDYDRNSGYTTGAVDLKWKTAAFNYDRGTRISVDVMDNEESRNLAFGMAGATLMREKVAPEADAFTFATLAALDGIPRQPGRSQKMAGSESKRKSVLKLSEKVQHFPAFIRYLYEGSQRGGEEVIEDLYEKYHAELIRWCRRMTQNESAAEDLVQEAFYRALHHTQEMDGMDLAQGRAWLYRTVKNLFVDRFRRERRESVMAELPEEARYTDYGELENAQLLSMLPEEERILFTMRYMEGYNSRELGEIFGIPPATVRMRLASARRHLQKEWED